jgi:hypothetical protein
MRGPEARTYWEDRGLLLLVTSFLAGPLLWGLNLQIAYALVKWACSREQTFLLILVPALSLVATLGAAWLAWSCRNMLRETTDEGGTQEDRSHFLAIVAFGLNLLLALLIVLTAVPPLMLSPCE